MYGLHPRSHNNPKHEYLLDGVVLENITEEKDLGIFVSNDLSWNKNINMSIKSANRAIAWISRNVIVRDVDILRNIYKTLIRPKLESCVQLWNPAACHGNWSLILELESIQRRFTRLANDIGTLPYSERLEAFRLTTLGERRIRGDLIETYKMVNGIVDYGKNVFKVSRSGSNIVSKVNTSCSDKAILKLRSSFLPERVRNYWNKLPMYVKNSINVNIFKSNLEKFKKSTSERNSEYFWEVSEIIIDKIEGNSSYLENKSKFNNYLVSNPYVARRKGININRPILH